MFEVTIKYTGEYDEVRYRTYTVKAADRNTAKNKALNKAGLDGLKNAIINDTVQIY